MASIIVFHIGQDGSDYGTVISLASQDYEVFKSLGWLTFEA